MKVVCRKLTRGTVAFGELIETGKSEVPRHDALEKSILDLSHPTLRMLLTERNAANERAERAEQWQATLAAWGGTPEVVERFIKDQQERIREAENIEKALEEAKINQRELFSRLDGAIKTCHRLRQERETARRERSDLLTSVAAVHQTLGEGVNPASADHAAADQWAKMIGFATVISTRDAFLAGRQSMRKEIRTALEADSRCR